MLLRVMPALTTAFLLLSSSAQAFHPSEQTYGYVMPKKFQKYQRNGSQVYSWESAAPKAKAKKAKPVFFSNNSSEDEFEAPQKKKFTAKGPKELSGGPRPSIGPVAPPVVNFSGYGAGQIIIDTAGRKLYYTLPGGKAYMYPVAVGRAGFTWTGTHKITREENWPDWRPPAEMLQRRPDLPEYMTGGIRNPLGVKALYLGSTLYRIHGTNETKTIGTAASSGCFRMLNGHVVHLASISGVGTTVRVVSKLNKNVASAD